MIIKVRREPVFQLNHEPLDAIRRVNGVGAGKLVQGHYGCGLAVQSAYDVVVLSAKLNAGHVLQANNGAIRSRAEDDFSKFLLRTEPALGAHGVSELLAGRRGAAADFPGRIHRILTTDGADDLRHCNV